MKKTSTRNNFITVINEILTIARQRKIINLIVENDYIDGRTIKVEGKNLINFGSCSYLGLETDDRLKYAACEAVLKYGAQFSCSRTYLSLGLYKELEDLLYKIFNAPVVLAQSTTLGHSSIIPIVINANDAVILDQQAHYSMQDPVNNLQLKGITVTKVRHNRLDELQVKIDELKLKHDKIWYVIDGVYSMYGDIAPISELVELLDKNKQLYLYADDAHGMSWIGKNGRGKLLSLTELHPKMIVATSLAKGFGSAGGVFVFPNEELYWKVKTWGGHLTHSGPQQPAVLGASIASAKIHLSDEIYERQIQLAERIKFCNKVLKQYKLPIIAKSESPIFFIGLGLTKVGYNMVKRLADDGLYVNLGVYPAVPENCAGIRFTVTVHHTLDDIERLARRISYHLPLALKEEERTMDDIYTAFRSFLKKTQKSIKKETSKKLAIQNELNVQYTSSVNSISKKLWDDMLAKHGAFDWEALRLLEEVFSDNEKKEDNWGFHYFIISDQYGIPILATFFTSVLTKDDMLAPADVSRKIELQRLNDPNYLVSKTLMMGTLITYGNHLYLDKQSPDWKKALSLLLDSVKEIQEKEDITSIYLRDLDEDIEIRDVMLDEGFVKYEMPENHVLVNNNWNNREDYIAHLTSKKRNLLKANVLKHESSFSIKLVENAGEKEIDKWYELYNNVRIKKFEINSFPLPKKFFSSIAKSICWECLELRIKEAGNEIPVAIMFNYKNAVYSSMIVGIDYNYLEKYSVYKQILFQTILLGIENKAEKIYFGLTASLEKRKLGAVTIPQMAYIQMKDNFNYSLIAMMPTIEKSVY